MGLTIDQQGNLFVADSGNNRIEELSPSGVVLSVWGAARPPGVLADAPGQLYGPTGLVADSGHVYVADTFNGRVQVFDARGNPLVVWSHMGPLPALQTILPTAVAVDVRHRIYVGDPWLGRISVLSSTGHPLKYWSIEPDAGRGLALAVDRAARVYAANARTGHVEVYARDGSRLGYLSDSKSRPISFDDPTAVAIDPLGDMYVAEAARHSVARFAPAPSH
jgi:DNA-binding beta-propeller fold protein YncE